MPVISLPNGERPAAAGGTIEDGTYVLRSIDLYGDTSPTNVYSRVLTFRGESYQANETLYAVKARAMLNSYVEAGTFTTSGTSLVTSGAYCGFSEVRPLVRDFEYSAVDGRLLVFTAAAATEAAQVETYDLQPDN